MTITEVRIKLVDNDPFNERLLAYAVVAIEEQLIITDMKLLRGDKGLFVGMPARKITDKCSNCNRNNPLRYHYCWNCGVPLDPSRHIGKIMYQDVTYPIRNDFRKVLEEAIIKEYYYQLELKEGVA